MLETQKSAQEKQILDKHRAGLLLHPTSLASGDIGPDARRVVDFLAQTGLSVWQTLPLGPTHADGSPYNCSSVHAADPRLISLEVLTEKGWLKADAVKSKPEAADRLRFLSAAYAGFKHHASQADRADFADYSERERHWLDDYVLFQALRRENSGRSWWRWPAALRDRDPKHLGEARSRLADEIAQVRFEQFVFAHQWRELRAYAAERNVQLFGDMPIFVAHDSAEVWAQREYFRLTPDGQPEVVAGVPPDYFSKYGQRWGNPLYNWDRMRDDGFRWWIARLESEFQRFDLVRVDHFRGFEAYWEVPVAETTAVNGRWVPGPGAALFDALLEHFDALPLVVEDLGLITPEVHALREQYRLPGMRVLQFAFDGGPDNPYLPHRYEPDSVVYTGTHDNDTTCAWFDELDANQQEYVRDYLGYPHESMPWPLIRAALASVARLAIIPMQDVLGLGSGNRMNMPGTAEDNWMWRFSWKQLDDATIDKLRHLVHMYGRAIAEK